MHNPEIMCIYHANCADGLAAAWAVQDKYPQTRLFPARYGDEPPYDKMTQDTILYIVDFSYLPEYLTRIAEKVDLVVLIDHHESAMKRLQDAVLPKNIMTHLVMSHSGCVLTWRYLHGTDNPRPMPEIFRYIEDRDLWRFELPLTRNVMEAFFADGLTMETMRQWVQYTPETIEARAGVGAALRSKREADIRSLISLNRVVVDELRVGGRTWHGIPVLNCPPMWVSDAGHMMDENVPFALMWAMNGDGEVICSLRSRKPHGEDVAAIAALLGGGGHRHAAGFRTTLAQMLEWLS